MTRAARESTGVGLRLAGRGYACRYCAAQQEVPAMPLQLDHTIVPAYDKVKSAEFIARIFGLKYEGTWGHFAPVKVNDILTLDFDNAKDPRSNHYAFLASRRGVRLNPPTGEGRGRYVRQRPRLSIRRRDQPQASGPRLLLRMREWPRLGSHHAHLHHGLTGRLVDGVMVRRDGRGNRVAGTAQPPGLR